MKHKFEIGEKCVLIATYEEFEVKMIRKNFKNQTIVIRHSNGLEVSGDEIEKAGIEKPKDLVKEVIEFRDATLEAIKDEYTSLIGEVPKNKVKNAIWLAKKIEQKKVKNISLGAVGEVDSLTE